MGGLGVLGSFSRGTPLGFPGPLRGLGGGLGGGGAGALLGLELAGLALLGRLGWGRLPTDPAGGRLAVGRRGPLHGVAVGIKDLIDVVGLPTRAGSNVPTNLPTTTIVDAGPYRFTRNPIYLGMVLGLIGLAIAINSLWLLMMLVPFALVIRYGVITREEAYLERKFGDVYRRYCARVRRWL